MRKSLWDNFFRKDLNLKSRWWHRLFFVVFVISFLYALYSIWDTPLPKYGEVDSLQNRMSNELQLLPELVATNEKIGVYENNLHDSLYERNDGWVLRQPDVYCSRNIVQRVDEISQKTGVTSYKGNGATEIISLDAFKNYISRQKANCVYITSIDNNTKVIAYAWFVGENLRVWKESTIATTIYIIKWSFVTTIPFLLLIIIYYKVFLYIVFGSKKEND